MNDDAKPFTYRGMTASDATSDDEIRRMIEAGELIPAAEDEPFRGPEEWHATGWDADRGEG